MFPLALQDMDYVQDMDYNPAHMDHGTVLAHMDHGTVLAHMDHRTRPLTSDFHL